MPKVVPLAKVDDSSADLRETGGMEVGNGALGTWRYDCRLMVFREVKSDLSGILKGTRDPLAERGIPIRIFAGTGPSAGGHILDMAVSEREALRAWIRLGESKFQVLLSMSVVPNEIGAGPKSENRQEFEEARRQRREAALAAHQKAMEAFEARRQDHERQLGKHEEEVRRLQAEWHSRAGMRKAALAARRGGLKVLALIPILGGLALAGVIFWVWPLGSYYEKVTTTSMGFLIFKLIALIFPWICILAPASIGLFIGKEMIRDSSKLSEPEFEEPPPPPEPLKPAPPQEVPEGPFDVLDSKELVLGYCRQTVLEAVKKALHAQPSRD